MFRDTVDIEAGVLDPDEKETLLNIFKQLSFSLKVKTGLLSLLILSSIRYYKLNTFSIKRFFIVRMSNFTSTVSATF
jgi:hypothetical protein